MSWWDVVLEKVEVGDVLSTPGRGIPASGQRPFEIIRKDPSGITLSSGKAKLLLESDCFHALEAAFSEDPSLWLRGAVRHDVESLETSVDRVIREATGSRSARGHYVSSILEHCGLVRYSMRGNRKGIELTGGPGASEPRFAAPRDAMKGPGIPQAAADREPFNIAVISDLHLSQGRDPCTRRFSLNEDFFFDGQFDRFLSHLERESARRARKWHLVIAGDMADFLQVTRRPKKPGFSVSKREEEYGLGTPLEKSVWKMKAMMDGHAVFFKALGRFLSQGNRCTIITGNHDIEWTVPGQQEAFRQEMKAYLPEELPGQNETVLDAIGFCPWFYYEPGLLWVEHGHQYDGMNAFDFPFYPYLPDSKALMLPGGSFFVRYIFNKVEQIDPFADNIKPLSRYVRKYALRLLLSPKILSHARYFLEIFRKIKTFTPEALEPLRRKNEEGMRAEAERFGIDPRVLNSIRRFWVPCFLYNKSKLENIKSFFMYTAGGRYRAIASVIQRQLGVRYVVFGHTHDADLYLFHSEAKAEYANSGTWTKIFSGNPTERLLREEQESVFVQILRDENDKLELMKWKDELGRGERVHLFE
jgi:UDP-2,3-diacylglucosamine pyrophosphatase LpxH